MTSELRTLPALLGTLRETEPPSTGVLSVYLDTSPERMAGQDYLLSLRDGCKALRGSLPPSESDAFEAAVAQVERFLAGEFVPTAPGLAVFASGGDDYFHQAVLPARPVDDVAWGPRPELGPLQGMLDDYERVAILLLDKERARLYTVFLGEIEERHTLEDVVPGKQATGGWFALAQTRYARHHEDHVLRHVKRAIRLLEATWRRRPFERLLVSGPPEAVTLLRQHLPRPLRSRLAGTLQLELFASEAEVRQAALELAERLEREAELRMLDELFEAATSSYAEVGLDATLAAVSTGRAHLLFVADSFAGPGSECPACGRLAAEVERCPACGQATRPVASLRERVTRRALDQGARVEVVSGQAAARLAERGGLGAWTRY